ESQPRLPLFFIRSMTSEALVRKNGPDLAIKIDLRRRDRHRQRQQPQRSNRIEASHVALDIAHLIQSNFPEGQVAQSVERSPEKAGVGGSIPSLATMFSRLYGPLRTQFHSISFQNFGAQRPASG